MSEEFLRHLMILFGMLAKQGGGASEEEVNFVRNFLIRSQVSGVAVDDYLKQFTDKASEAVKFGADGKLLVSEKDSVKMLGICRKANKVLNKEQKVTALVHLYEMKRLYERYYAGKEVCIREEVKGEKTETGEKVFVDHQVEASLTFKPREEVLKTAGDVFNLNDAAEIGNIDRFCQAFDTSALDDAEFLIVDEKADGSYVKARHVNDETLGGFIAIIHLKSVNLYFLKYVGSEDVTINGINVEPGSIYAFPSGGFVKTPKGNMYYTDIAARLTANVDVPKISFEVNHVWFKFKTGGIGLRDINISEQQGKLVGIMGASGAGKTTLLNVLCGNECPSEGEVIVNGLNLHTQKEQLQGVIGLIPQDDLLIEELTVYQNLYYNAKLCFRHLSEAEIDEKVCKTLRDLGLYERKDLQVGSPLNKMISGGQRKRLNIALELIREPGVLFVDEPTSGLSSRDSENVMNLLRELALKGKLVFVVIHQPSSDIYKMFDKMFILDTGGYPVYYGNPVNSLVYFKSIDEQVNADKGQCPTCGTVNPEAVFNILDACQVDEQGNKTSTLRRSPEQWCEIYREVIEKDDTDVDRLQKILPESLQDKPETDDRGKAVKGEDGKPKIKKRVTEPWVRQFKQAKAQTVNEQPPRSLDIPSWFKQFRIYTVRDFWAKISNTQYILLNILEAPVLGFVLAYLIRYIVDPDSDVYIFRENDNIPIYIFMATVVAIFFGLIISAEEIFKDAKILKREAFLNLSRSAYLMSKIVILMGISAIQMILFIVVGNAEIAFQGMNIEFFMMLFAVSVSSNILGLIISSTFNSIVTIYIMIPLIMIPQMVLGGAMFTFDKLNKDISSVDKVPLVAEVIPARYAYEGLIVYQYKHNKFKRAFFEDEMIKSQADFRQVYVLPKLADILDNIQADFKAGRKDGTTFVTDLALLHNEFGKEMRRTPDVTFADLDKLTPETYDEKTYATAKAYLDKLVVYYRGVFDVANTRLEKKISYCLEKQGDMYNKLKDEYFNETVSDVVRKTFDKNKILRDGDKFIQILDPIYQLPEPEGILRFRSHFFAPVKNCFGILIDTLWFNIMAVWIISAFLYALLYYDVVRKAFEALGDIKIADKIAKLGLKEKMAAVKAKATNLLHKTKKDE